MDPYSLKKRLLTPRTVLRRRRETSSDEWVRRVLELHYYNPSIYAFMAAMEAKPDLLHDFPLAPRATIVDVGAFVGEWSEPVATRYGEARIFAFEPGPPFFRQLREVAEKHPHLTALPYGLGARTQQARLSTLDGPGAAVVGDGERGPGHDIEIRDIDSVFDELGLREVDLLKVNIEGGEYDLFDRLVETDRLVGVDSVLVQFHEWHPNAYRRRRAVRRALRRTHDEIWNYPWVFEYWRRRAPGGTHTRH